MKAIVYHDRGDVRYDPEFPEPQIVRPDDVKIKVHYCGICGSDLKEFSDGPIFFSEKGTNNEISDLPYPQCMGHEISGEIVGVGSEVDSLVVGDKVVVEVTGTCFDRYRFPDSPGFNKPKCGSCLEGHYNACDYLGLTGLGFTNGGCAEYLVTAANKAIKFQEDIIPMNVAALIQPIAVSWHAVRISHFKEGHSALILGGGPIGLTTIFALKGHKSGKIVVSEPALARRQLAEKLGCVVFDPTGKTVDECVEQLRALSPNGYGFHHSYDCSGVPATFKTSIKALNIRGVATNVAVWAHKAVDYYPMDATFSEKIITGSICFVKEDFEDVVEALHNGHIPVEEVKLLITSTIHLEDGVEKGFLELINHKEKHIKILFSPKEKYRVQQA
ncbi:polyol dehydrogenase [Scheffersomyces xylosifermentans]|uniref:polyol dehydrogenase n=1 Tax=Scheffersomyces xylosifermentans TaxID=1304137 RepID=UPI00315DAC39